MKYKTDSQQWVFRAPPLIKFGNDSSKEIGEIIKSLNLAKVLIITDYIIEKLGILNDIKSSLDKFKISYLFFKNIKGEPNIKDVEEGLQILQSQKFDGIVAIGGGSVIDASKAISIMATNKGNIADYKGLDKIPKKGLPIIAVPTTAGTGSEVTKFTIIAELETNVKMLIGSPYLIPDVAIIDPKLTIDCPKQLTAAVGIDALTHAIEAYISKKANPVTDIFALQSIKLIANNLIAAWSDGEDFSAREKVMLGAFYAGLAFSNSSVALVHGMSRPIGANFHIPHGLSNACLLGKVMEFSYCSNIERFSKIAEAMIDKNIDLLDESAAKESVILVKKLIKNLEIPSLKDLIPDSDKFKDLISKMAIDAIASGSPSNNPRIASLEEIEKLYELSYK